MRYGNSRKASEEIINLNAILNLPKGTEHFLSDIHGEYESFVHILKNASGVIKSKIDMVFENTLPESERKSLATLIYYPEDKLEIIKQNVEDMREWYTLTLHRLIEVCKVSASKYTRSEVRKALPEGFDYIIDELLHTQDYEMDKNEYYRRIVSTIIEIGCADAFIIAMSNLIQRLAIARLHIIGDIFDRGPGAPIIVDTLMKHHSVDIQWGNHDIEWMGASFGSMACIANVIRLSARYDNMNTIEGDYGISIRPLAVFAMEAYAKDDCATFIPRHLDVTEYSKHDEKLISKIHKAITVIQFKLEGQVIMRHPEYKMDDRLLLNNIDYERGVINIDGTEYELKDKYFPTIDPSDPYKLNPDEQEVMERLRTAFMTSERLKTHMRFICDKGAIYNRYNSNLMFHGCIPMTEDGDFEAVGLFGKKLKGKALLDEIDHKVRQGMKVKNGTKEHTDVEDLLWYLWCGSKSPLFGKDKITTFEQYFIDEPLLHVENKDPYYKNVEKRDVCIRILKEFGLQPAMSHIINGHVPVEIKKGQSPIKAGGKLFVIDGGLSKGYQPKTGIAGYTLLFNSHGMILASHEPFESKEKAVRDEIDIHSKTVVLEKAGKRKMVSDTDQGIEIKERIKDLEELLKAYRSGLIKQNSST
ncbi:MAG TPA: fructose-1,6-bisphosphatase, partial [Candidatus Monoglobus merdigallinarum]|nr:fructose-1,6-bisphosphatase [Candidatus Monoglobus merdigallinarum]